MTLYHLFQYPQYNGFVTRTNDSLKTPRGQYWANAALSAIFPPYGDFMKLRDAQKEMDNALALYGMGYEDIKYITKTIGYNAMSNATRGTLNYVSSNVSKLYRH